ncbi:ATP-binding cassette protein subfamily A, member 9, partial [Strigomonas culicis]
MSADEATKLVKGASADDAPFWAILHVNSLTAENLDVKIQLNSSSIPATRSMTTDYYIGGLETGSDELYAPSGFLTLQTMVYNYYAENVLKEPSLVTNFTYTPMPVKAYDAYSFLMYGAQLAPFITVLGYLYPVSQMAKRIVLEKELRIREAMLIMGLSEVIMYLAWTLIYMIAYTVTSLIMAILMRATYLKNTDFGYIFFILLFFSFSTIALSYAIAAVFSKSRLAAILSPIIYFVMAVPLFAMQSAPPSAQTGAMVLSPSAYAVGMSLLFRHELEGGAHAKELRFVNDDPNLLLVFVFLFFDIIIYLLLTVYFDLVIPKDWGTSRNPLFFIVDPIKYCFCRRRGDDEDCLEDGRAADGVFEPIDDADAAPVRIRGLRKKFKRGGQSFVAVNNLYWSLKEGDISVLLGHNGAGKSTTINLMTGMLAADRGDCVIYGESIVRNKRAARQNIGLCPQHNILWPALTVRQHLEYYAAIKGLRKREREAAVRMLLEGVDMVDKEDYPAKALSGGQKRKLSVGVAFVGRSRLIFLDEPTAGMDVGARRHTWGLLKKLSSRHTILLTTHFMDEADLLGNTMAIMSKGRMQCSGTNMFLKSKLGIGFVLTMSVVAHVDRRPIADVVTRFVPQAESLGSGAGEVAYRLPLSAKSTFPQLLTTIEDSERALGINAYSLSATTLEEIFLQIAEAEAEADTEHDAATAAEGASVVWNVDIVESAAARR